MGVFNGLCSSPSTGEEGVHCISGLSARVDCNLKTKNKQKKKTTFPEMIHQHIAYIFFKNYLHFFQQGVYS